MGLTYGDNVHVSKNAMLVAFLLGGLAAAVAAAVPARAWLGDSSLPPVHGAVLKGDINGDGRPDSAAVRCRPGDDVASLVVLAGHRSVSRRILAGCGAALGVTVLAPIDRVPGAEIVVTEGAGSVYFADVYTFRQDKLVQMSIAGRGKAFPNEFLYYGGVAHDAAVDCLGAGSGEVMVSGWGLGAKSLGAVTRTRMRVRGTRFYTVSTRTFPIDRDHRRYGGFDTPEPFPSCAIARASERS